MREIVLLSGTPCVPLMNKIAEHLGLKPADFLLARFADGEIRVQIKRNIRGADVFIIQSTHPPADNLMELLLLIDAARRASAERITAVIPYYGYARQDRKDQPRVPISAKLVANMIEVAGADRVLTVDLHADQVQGFFDIPVDNLYAFPVFHAHLRDHLGEEEWMVVGPDVGSTKRAQLFAKQLGNLPMALVDKRRPRPNAVEMVQVIGDVRGKSVILVDDIIDTGNTIRKAADALREAGAKRIWVVATHGLFSGDAAKVLDTPSIEKIIVTNTVPDRKAPKGVIRMDISGLLAEAIHRIHENKSISALFEGGVPWLTTSLWQR